MIDPQEIAARQVNKLKTDQISKNFYHRYFNLYVHYTQLAVKSYQIQSQHLILVSTTFETHCHHKTMPKYGDMFLLGNFRLWIQITTQSFNTSLLTLPVKCQQCLRFKNSWHYRVHGHQYCKGSYLQRNTNSNFKLWVKNINPFMKEPSWT